MIKIQSSVVTDNGDFCGDGSIRPKSLKFSLSGKQNKQVCLAFKMNFSGNHNPHKNITNFKQLKNFIVNHPEPNLDIYIPLSTPPTPPPPPAHTHTDPLKLDHPSLKMNRKLGSKVITDSSASRRLNLKEYMHLNSIQKKAKSKSFSKSYENGTFSTSNSVQLSKKGDDSRIGTGSRRSREVNVVSHEVLREEVQKKIEEGIKQLQDLSMFMRTEYSQKDNIRASELFLFDVLKGVNLTGSVLAQVGEKVGEYQGELRHHNYQYYWSRRSKVLHSPAKMKNGYELTITAFDTLLGPSDESNHK